MPQGMPQLSPSARGGGGGAVSGPAPALNVEYSIGVSIKVQQRQGQMPAGLYIQSVARGSGAQRAGLRERQRITKVDGKPVMADDDFVLGKLEAERALCGPRYSGVKVKVAFWNNQSKKEETHVVTCQRTNSN
jgi:S1-C subfamily serine protease